MQIYRLGTMLETPGVETTFEREQDEAWNLVLFLRMNNLVADDSLPRSREEVKRDFILMTDDVTEEGFAVLKEGFYKWLDKNDDTRRTTIDMSPLEKALLKVRQK